MRNTLSALNTQQGEETTYYSNLGTCKCIVASHPQMQCGYPEDYNGIFFKDFQAVSTNYLKLETRVVEVTHGGRTKSSIRK